LPLTGWEQQRRVVERAHVALLVDVAEHLEAARGALMGDLGHVAPQAVDAGSCWDASVDAGFRVRSGAALHERCRDEWRLGAPNGRHLGRGLTHALAERQQVVVTAAESRQRHGAGRRHHRQDECCNRDRPEHDLDQAPTTS
jgi:hypothetical protein